MHDPKSPGNLQKELTLKGRACIALYISPALHQPFDGEQSPGKKYILTSWHIRGTVHNYSQ